MGAYTSIRGWIEVHLRSLPEIETLLADYVGRAAEFDLSPEGAEFYNRGWVLPAKHINAGHYIFYGADIRTAAVGFIRSQMAGIAALYMRDEDIDEEWGVYAKGRIDVEEDGTHGHPNEVWWIRGGKLIRMKSGSEQGEEADAG